MWHRLFKLNKLTSNSISDSPQDTPLLDVLKEHARVVDWTPAWDIGAPLPQVFSNGYRTYLTYLNHTPDPGWDGAAVTVIDNASDHNFSLTLVSFIKPNSHRFGIANDEAANGHPLYDRGLRPYAAHVIENSSWLEELKGIHKVHPHYSDQQWKSYWHFSLFFHDNIFEIIAEGYEIEVFDTTFKNIAIEIARRMNS